MFQIMKSITRMLYIPPELGAQTTLYCALDNQLANESGEFYANCTRFEHTRCAVSNYITSYAIDDETAKRLWDLSCELVKLEDQYNIPPVDDDGTQKTNSQSKCIIGSRVTPVATN